MNLKERLPEGLNLTSTTGAARHSSGTGGAGGVTRESESESEYHWVRGSATLRTSKATGSRTIDYNFYGLHYRPNGTYELYGVPDGMHLDIRNIPRMYRGERERRESREIVLAELEKELKVQKDMLLLSDVRPDGESCCLVRTFRSPSGHSSSPSPSPINPPSCSIAVTPRCGQRIRAADHGPEHVR
jgi:hypothetical protein